MDSARTVGGAVGRRAEKKLERDSSNDNNRKCVVDLNEVTFIDKKGERLLGSMSREGARFIATGIYTKHVLEQRCAR
jgi:anti-anti-sigma regulatory factor